MALPRRPCLPIFKSWFDVKFSRYGRLGSRINEIALIRGPNVKDLLHPKRVTFCELFFEFGTS